MRLPPLYKGDDVFRIEVEDNEVYYVLESASTGEVEVSRSVLEDQPDGTKAAKQALIDAAIAHTQYIKKGWELGKSNSKIFPISTVEELLINLPHIYRNLHEVERQALYKRLMEVLN